MTELVVALDGPEPLKLLLDLRSVGVTWFKVGPLTLTDQSVHSIQNFSTLVNLFYDAKLADHGPYVCTEVAKRLGANGYAALSTSTDEATEAALRGAEGSTLKVWKHVAPTSRGGITRARVTSGIIQAIDQGAHGVILGAWNLVDLDVLGPECIDSRLDFVCPAIRIVDTPGDGHIVTSAPENCVKRGVTHAVVGRPIWQSPDPVAAAKRYLEALR